MSQLDEKKLRALIERREKASLWSKWYTITPRLVSEVFGNGEQLIGLSPIDYRPNYFVVRVDSKWNTSNFARDCPLLCDHLDEIYDAIEEQFIDWPWASMYGMKKYRDRDEEDSARIDFSCGCAWFQLSWMDLLAKALNQKPAKKARRAR